MSSDLEKISVSPDSVLHNEPYCIGVVVGNCENDIGIYQSYDEAMEAIEGFQHPIWKQVKSKEGNWIDVPCDFGNLIINIGDMLQRLTNNRLPSTTHRVVNPAAERRGFSRYSMPYFLHFRPDYLIETLPGCFDTDHPNLYPEPITAHDYMMERLGEIGLA